MKETKYIRRDFYSVAWVMPRGGTWGCLGFKNQILSRHLSVMISPPKPLDQIQPNEVCELLTCMGRATAKKFGPAHWGPGEGSKGQIISITKTISKIFIPNFVCVLTNERYKTYQMGFSFCHLGHSLGVGLGGA